VLQNNVEVAGLEARSDRGSFAWFFLDFGCMLKAGMACRHGVQTEAIIGVSKGEVGGQTQHVERAGQGLRDEG
jgi:hypothetical protein